jgi:hypothetical protein
MPKVSTLYRYRSARIDFRFPSRRSSLPTNISMAAPPSVLVRSLARTCTSSSLTRSTPALARAFRSSPPAAKWRLLPTPSPCPSPASFSPSLIRQLSSTLRSRQQERASSTTTFPHPQSPESLSSATLQSSSTASSASSSSSSFQSRFSSSSSSSSSSDGTRPDLSTPAVARWLYFTSFLTFSIVVVGGLTRLTESGLSITEWKPVKGMLPPRGPVEWEDEFAKYRASEEGRMYVFFLPLPEPFSLLSSILALRALVMS